MWLWKTKSEMSPHRWQNIQIKLARLLWPMGDITKIHLYWNWIAVLNRNVNHDENYHSSCDSRTNQTLAHSHTTQYLMTLAWDTWLNVSECEKTYIYYLFVISNDVTIDVELNWDWDWDCDGWNIQWLRQGVGAGGKNEYIYKMKREKIISIRLILTHFSV